MIKRWTVLFTAVVLTVAACGTSATPSPGGTKSPAPAGSGTPTATAGGSPTGSAGASGSPAGSGSPGASGSAGASGSPAAVACPSDISADLKMGGWSAAGSTEEAQTTVLIAHAAGWIDDADYQSVQELFDRELAMTWRLTH